MAAATLAGCSVTMTVTRWPHAAAHTPTTAPSAVATTSPSKPAEPAFSDAPDAPPQHAERDPARPPTINVFGEFNGKPANAAKPATDTTYRQHTSPDAGADADVSVDPAGKWMVFSSTRDGDHPALYLERTDAPSVTQLTNGAVDDAQPVFSPDGKRIAFCSNRGGNWHLYTMDTDGRNVTQVTEGNSEDLHPSFSPDSSRLVYCSRGSSGGPWELWIVSLHDNSKKNIGQGLFPCWSPEKGCDRIVFQKTRARGSRWFSLWTLEYTDGEPRRVTEVAVSTNAALVTPSWSPDGKRLAFATIVEPANTHEGKPVGQEDVWIVNADGTGRRRLTNGSATNLNPCWAADNRVYFVSDRVGHDSIWSVATGANANDKEGAQEAQVPQRPQTKSDALGTSDTRLVAP